MSKLKEELRLKMLGQLSGDKTELDINNAYEVCVKFAVGFNLFCAENTFNFDGEKYRMKELKPTFKTPEELLTLYLENGRNTSL